MAYTIDSTSAKKDGSEICLRAVILERTKVLLTKPVLLCCCYTAAILHYRYSMRSAYIRQLYIHFMYGAPLGRGQSQPREPSSAVHLWLVVSVLPGCPSWERKAYPPIKRPEIEEPGEGPEKAVDNQKCCKYYMPLKVAFDVLATITVVC